MSSKGADVIDALLTRLGTISQGNGYQTTVKGVYAKRTATMNTSASELPLIEIIKDGEKFEHQATNGYLANTEFVLYIVTVKDTSDQEMENLLQDIRRCLYGGSASATGNTGVNLGGKAMGIWLIDSVGDLGMVESNRIYTLRILVKTHRTTYKD